MISGLLTVSAQARLHHAIASLSKPMTPAAQLTVFLQARLRLHTVYAAYTYIHYIHLFESDHNIRIKNTKETFANLQIDSRSVSNLIGQSYTYPVSQLFIQTDVNSKL